MVAKSLRANLITQAKYNRLTRRKCLKQNQDREKFVPKGNW